ncbi:hypothetical protein [Roseovarius litorisediminis]|uniref:hypothetical protein n=1 Tax=Roseovarius litorisediminis TaxID=1312363 RepID=UPI00111BFCFE|nr:hypothetical protein [Roseovarius litorisediminis]
MHTDHKILLRAILVEIDETILPREITLTADTGATAVLTVSNRRLLSLFLSDDETGQTGELPSDPTSAAKQYISRLLYMFGRCDEVALEVSERAPAKLAVGLSCSAQSLADAAGLCDIYGPLNPSLDRFLQDIKDMACAWIELGPPPAAQKSHGSEGLIKMLENFERASLNRGQTLAQAQKIGGQEPSCVLLPLKGDRLLTMVVSRNTKLIALTQTSEKQAICDNWYTITTSLTADRFGQKKPG